MGQRDPSIHRQVAAVCYRRTSAGLQFLLVRTADDRWTFPKGNVEPGQSETEAAQMEAYEEAGASGSIEPEPFTLYRYTKGPPDEPRARLIEAQAFLFVVQEAFPPQETFRTPQWFAPNDAKAMLAVNRHPEDAQQLARVAQEAVRKLN